MKPESFKYRDRNIRMIVESTDVQYLGWIDKFIPILTDSLDVLIDAAYSHLREDGLIGEADRPDLYAVIFDGDEDKGSTYSLMFAANEPLGVIFEGHRALGVVHGAV